jgi:hypothetical protein
MDNHNAYRGSVGRFTMIMSLHVAIGIAVVSCGGEADQSSDEPEPSGGSAPGFSSGLPAEKPLNGLTEDEQAVLCDSLTDYSYDRLLGDAQEAFCRYTALLGAGRSMAETDAELRGECAGLFEACLMLEREDLTTGGVQTCPTIGAACTATVTEYERCFTDAQLAYEAALADLPACEGITLDDFPVQLPVPTQPASCVRYAQKCSN